MSFCRVAWTLAALGLGGSEAATDATSFETSGEDMTKTTSNQKTCVLFCSVHDMTTEFPATWIPSQDFVLRLDTCQCLGVFNSFKKRMRGLRGFTVFNCSHSKVHWCQDHICLFVPTWMAWVRGRQFTCENVQRTDLYWVDWEFQFCINEKKREKEDVAVDRCTK